MTSSHQPVSAADILIVDDTLENLRLLSTMLIEKGYKVRQAVNGERALKAVKAVMPDLILLDIMMPGIDGYEVCRQLKANPATEDIPIIFISALNDTSGKVQAFSAGGADYITKPFQLEEVLARVQHQLSLRQLQRQLQERNQILQQEIYERQQAQKALQASQFELVNLVAALKAEQEKSERLLLNILPKAITQQLKQGQGTIAEQFTEATILFADIVDFTSYASCMEPKELVNLLNQIFSTFDELVDKHGLEKIKTIGDEYMVVGGLPTPRADHAEAVAQMALDMQAQIMYFKRADGQPFRLRVGINTGPVVAGVIGTKKFLYDLWGDAVNIASRMESQGQAGYIQATDATYQRLHHRYHFERRGSLYIKGKGCMQVYWLLGKS